MSVDNNGICGPWARYLTDTHPLVSFRPCGDCVSGRTGPWFDFNEAWECWWSIACSPTYMIEPAIRAIILAICLFRLWYPQCKDADHTNVKTPSRNIIKSSKETTLIGWTLEFWTFLGMEIPTIYAQVENIPTFLPGFWGTGAWSCCGECEVAGRGLEDLRIWMEVQMQRKQGKQRKGMVICPRLDEIIVAVKVSIKMNRLRGFNVSLMMIFNERMALYKWGGEVWTVSWASQNETDQLYKAKIFPKN